MNILNEIWITAIGFEDSCEVSNLGNVRTFDRVVIRSNGRKTFVRGQLLKPMIRNGYPSVTLTNATTKKRLSHFIHSMVALAFIGERPHGYWINHIDGDKTNNSVCNLEYCTPSENRIHALNNGLCKVNSGENHHFAKLSREDVLIIRDRLAKGDLPSQIASDYGVTATNIRCINRLNIWKHI